MRSIDDLHAPVYEFRDPIYGFVKLSAAERDIVNCPTFQRLRDIRQLAMAHMVYPGATHTRFEHSVGCVHLADRMLTLFDEHEARGNHRSLQQEFGVDQDAMRRGRKLLRLASLLHDLGHPAFSHSGEHLFAQTGNQPGNHEQMTALLIRHSEVADAIRNAYEPHGISPEDAIAVATEPVLAEGDRPGREWLAFLNSLLAGELGADRIDYLLRDAHHSGQPTGLFDYEKLLNALTLAPPLMETEDHYRVGLDEGGWLAGEQMVVARYLMYVSVYFHKTKRIYEKHLEDYVAGWLKSRFGSPYLPSHWTKYVTVSDSRVLGDLFDDARNACSSLHEHARPFVDRTHYRLATELVLADNCQAEKGRRVPDKRRFDDLCKAIQCEFGSKIVVDAVDHPATKMFTEAGQITVLLNGVGRSLEEISELVRGMSATIWRGRVYAPEAIRDDVRKRCMEFLERHPAGREASDE